MTARHLIAGVGVTCDAATHVKCSPKVSPGRDQSREPGRNNLTIPLAVRYRVDTRIQGAAPAPACYAERGEIVFRANMPECLHVVRHGAVPWNCGSTRALFYAQNQNPRRCPMASAHVSLAQIHHKIQVTQNNLRDIIPILKTDSLKALIGLVCEYLEDIKKDVQPKTADPHPSGKLLSFPTRRTQ